MDIKLLAPRFFALFAGLERVHGTYDMSNPTVEPNTGKLKGRAVTRSKPLTVELWAQHLAGEGAGLGIVPIRDDATCMWGAIDIDSYNDFDIVAINSKCRKLELPLVTCRSKSGGAHLYILCVEATPAALIRIRLQEMAAALGVGTSEIFPKQNALLSKEDSGSWLNAIFFDGTSGGRYPILPTGEPMEPEAFLEYAESMKQPRAFFDTPIVFKGELFSNGPCCLEKLVQLGGFSDGQRNNLMFEAAIYARKASLEWPTFLREINHTACETPLPPEEIDALIGQLRRRPGYNYRCTSPHLAPYCDGALCRLRAYGVGKIGNDGEANTAEESFPRLGALRKLMVEPPVYYWDTPSGKTLRLTLDDLNTPGLFRKRCIADLGQMPVMPTASAWAKFVNAALAHVIEMDAPADSSDGGQLWGLLEKYCLGNTQAKVQSELLQDKPWTHEGTTWFTIAGFTTFLTQRNFKSELLKPQAMSVFFHERDLEQKFFNFKGKGKNAWGVPAFARPEPQPDAVEAAQSSTPF